MRLKLTTTKIVHLSLGEKNIYIKNNKLTFIFFYSLSLGTTARKLRYILIFFTFGLY